MATDLATESKIESLSLVSNDPGSTYAPEPKQLAEAQRKKLWISFELLQHVSSCYSEEDELIASVLAKLGNSQEDTSEDWQEHHLTSYFTELFFKDRIDILATWIHLMHEQGVPVTFTELANICAKIYAAAPAKIGFVDRTGHLKQIPRHQENMNRLAESIRMVYDWGVEQFGDAAVPFRGRPFDGTSQRFTFTPEAAAESCQKLYGKLKKRKRAKYRAKMAQMSDVKKERRKQRHRQNHSIRAKTTSTSDAERE